MQQGQSAGLVAHSVADLGLQAWLPLQAQAPGRAQGEVPLSQLGPVVQLQDEQLPGGEEGHVEGGVGHARSPRRFLDGGPPDQVGHHVLGRVVTDGDHVRRHLLNAEPRAVGVVLQDPGGQALHLAGHGELLGPADLARGDRVRQGGEHVQLEG